jgi:hypothetical protein
MNLLNTRNVIVIAAALLLAVGCSKDEKPKLSVNDYFQPDGEQRSVQKIFAQQHANAAREDGTFYAAHFSGGELNSLGLQKLNAMLAGPERGAVNIYLSIPKDNTYGPREASVIAQLSARGLASNSYSITAGDNPNVGAPAAQGLNGLTKQAADSGSSSSASAGLMGTK